MRLVAVAVCVLAAAGTASAQSPYVGASFIGDVVRVSGSSLQGEGGNGETFGGALRAGMALGERWGVELEFARTGEVDTSPVVVLPAEGFTFSSGTIGGPVPAIFPPPQIDAERRLSTISTVLWWNHEVSPRVSLAYLGGIAFTRSDSELRISYPEFPFPRVPIGGITFPPRLFEQASTSYGADVVVGIEGRIGMTDHVRLVPGIRMQTAVGGWSIRPGVGLQWMF